MKSNSDVTLTVNGVPRTSHASPWARLLDVVRDDFRLTGSKEGCGEGECGACTVLLDGEPVNSCLVALGQCAGRQVITVEGIASTGGLHPVQQALVARGGAQCGICTPGIVVCATYLIEQRLLEGLEDAAARALIRTHLSGNICRCTGYQLIVDAVLEAARSAPARGGV